MPCVPDKGCMVGGDAMRVTPRQALPSAGWLWAQLAFKNSMVHGDSAIHTKYRILLRSSSMREPRYPLPRVVCDSKRPRPTRTPRTGRSWTHPSHLFVFLGTYRAGGLLWCRIKIHGTPNGATTNISRRGASDRAKAHTPDSRL
ncbi:hypothetical protein L1887_45919 [Cichorium endivia]|nr:hypothetical protein L1887_45919 [Cichorium endivia]